ncbi:DUF2029 domain-containing protein [Falsihalocynthiibacter arcticus]|uniref:Glycosyltransferase RgtA/B/C/D-like domain-containing protein n=1 Tax=Falsihalocynthiibacter arcticus TaxID=1579316 RepID=A0A126V0A5_9RHOB|nr:DUF2029 domain-containing protein [Falsihalocynthiibacter arcticus]AML51129.1 hypothetical protein RC74_07530 [Falsihalocynthiibacter arcticus]
MEYETNAMVSEQRVDFQEDAHSLEDKLNSAYVTLIALACLIVWYAKLYPVTQPDHFKYLVPWLRAILQSNGFDVFATPFSNYTAGYITFLKLVSLLDSFLSELGIVKLTSVIGSGMAAYGVTLCLAAFGWSGMARTNAGLLYLLLPTIMLNGIGWGQADAFFTAFILYSMAAVLRERPLLAGLMFAVAVSFKLQAVFFAPFLFGYLLKWPKELLISVALFVPVYLIVNALYLLSGRELFDVLTIYADQAQTFTRLSMNAGNPWILMDILGSPEKITHHYSAIVVSGLAFATLVASFISWRVYATPFTSHTLLYFACISTALMPFILPKMHERFFFPAESLLFVAALVDFRLLRIVALTQLSGLAMYSIYHDTFGLQALIRMPHIAYVGVILMFASVFSLLHWSRT